MSPYFDLRSELFRQVFRDALAYPEYLATGNSREAAAWARADAALPALPDDASIRLDPAGRIVNVLCLSGIWCGDCVRSVPIVARLAEAAGLSVDLRFVDRDAISELRDDLRVLGAMRVPMVLFLTEDFHEIGRYGDRPLSVYRGEGGDGTRGRLSVARFGGRRGAGGRDRRVAGCVRADDPDGAAGAAAEGAAWGLRVERGFGRSGKNGSSDRRQKLRAIRVAASYSFPNRRH